MTVTIGAWVVPTIITLVLLGIMNRPYKRSGDYDFGIIFRLFWCIPIMFVWMVYFGILLWLK